MRAVDFIRHKRDGGTHAPDDLKAFIHAFARGEVPDYQAAAWAMAVYWRGMSLEETTALTEAMIASGETVSLADIPGVKVDKHSTGGVGDKTTLVLGPLLAACGLPVAKLSGRGLGHTGGTLDKLESIPGLRVDLTSQTFAEQVRRIGLAVAGQTANLVPADGKLYALRDVTATIESIPLIAASIMSKKIAGGADAIVLDVKVGQGAFMKTLPDAERLARWMMGIGERLGRRMGAVLSNMEQPLGQAVGNALEVREAVATLTGRGPADLRELCLALGSLSLRLAARCEGRELAAKEARARLDRALTSGAAYDKLVAMVQAQGGDARALDNDGAGLPQARLVLPVLAPQAGWCTRADALAIGQAAAKLGAGRERKGEPVDHAVGVVCRVKVGDRVEAGEPLAFVHANDERRAEEACRDVASAYVLTDAQPHAQPLILKVIESVSDASHGKQ